MANYILRTKVLNGKDLVCEGHSTDELKTFVRLHIHEKTQFYKTEALDGANPEWNEDLELRINDPATDQLEVEVVQQDINRDVDICDPCLLPLNTVQIGSKAVFEANLDLTKDGQPVGHIDLQFQIFPKDPTENITFNGPVLLRINITEASGVTEQEEEDSESEDTYLTFLLQGHDESEKIKSIVNKTSSDPAWNQSFSIICNDPTHDVIHMQMVSGDTVIIKDEVINVYEMEPGTRGTVNLSFEKGDVTGGHLGIEYESIDLNTMSKKPVKVHLKVLKGSNLLKLDADKSDPYVKISVGDNEVTTDVQKNTLDPEWNQEFDFVSTNPIYDNLTLRLLDKDISVDDKMMDNLVFPIRDLKTPEDQLPILYNVPLRLKGKPAGRLSFEILAEGECLRIQRAVAECILEFTVLEANFKNSQNVHITYGLRSNEEDEPKEAQLNQKITMRCGKPEEDALIVCFDDSETQDDLCDPIVIELSQVGVNGESIVKADTMLDDETTGHAEIQFSVREVKKEMKKEAQPEQPVAERSVPIAENIDDYCDFQWGTYGSSYSTSFTGYSNCTPLSSTISDAEIKYHHRHPVLDQDIVKPKRRSETFSGQIRSVELDSAQQDKFVVGDKYYATAILYGKSSRSSNKFGPIQSDAVEAKDANTISFNKFAFDFDKKLKKGDYIEVNLYHQSDNKQIAKSTIALEKVEQTEQESSNAFPLQEYKFVKNPAKIGTLKADLKHTIQFQ